MRPNSSILTVDCGLTEDRPLSSLSALISPWSLLWSRACQPQSQQHLSFSLLDDWFWSCLKACEKVRNPLRFSVEAQGASCKL